MVEISEEEITQIQNEMTQQKNENMQLRTATSLQQGGADPNLIEFQLELDNVIDRIEHLLRGHIASIDIEGNQVWAEPKDKNLKILNEKGIQFIMNFISFYLNRNTILSHYTEERINQILHDIGIELSNQLYFNYEKYGMDTLEKRTRYDTICLEIIHTIESAYNRALKGGERESLRTARTVMQSVQAGGSPQQGMYQQPKKRFSVFRPSTWTK